MDVNQKTENAIFFYILENPYLAQKCKGEFFKRRSLRLLFDTAKPFSIKYKTCPSTIEIKQLTGIKDWNDSDAQYVTDTIIDLLWGQKSCMNEFDETWLSTQVKAFITYHATMLGLENTLEYIKMNQANITIDNYQEIIDHMRKIFIMETDIDLGEDSAGEDFYDIKSHQTIKLKRFSTGDGFIDSCSGGGYWPGSLWVFVGAPKIGKSRVLQNLCAKAMCKGYNCAYISLELQEEMIIQRMGSNIFNVPMENYGKMAADSSFIGKKLQDFKSGTNSVFNAVPGECDVKTFPTSTETVDGLEAWLLKEETRISKEKNEDFKFKLIFVDYLNIMKNSKHPNTESLYIKIKDIAEDLRAMGMRNGWCIVTATQVKLAYFDSADMDMSSASESSALQATVDMMFGIISNPMMQLENYQFLKVLLNRVNSIVNIKQKYNIVPEYMRLIKTSDAPIRDIDDITDTVNRTKGIQKRMKMKFSGNQKPGSAEMRTPPNVTMASSTPDLKKCETTEGNLFSKNTLIGQTAI